MQIKEVFLVRDDDVRKLYGSARRSVFGSTVPWRKAAVALAVLAVGFLILFVSQRGLWGRLPFFPEPVLSDEEMAANLSLAYGAIQPMSVSGSSMLPLFADGQKAFVATDYFKGHSPERGDVVAVLFKTVPEPFISRVAFVPGDSFAKEGDVFRPNGPGSQLVLSPGDILYKQLVAYNYAVPNGTVILLGDNANDSFDSTTFGFVSIGQFAGKVVK